MNPFRALATMWIGRARVLGVIVLAGMILMGCSKEPATLRAAYATAAGSRASAAAQLRKEFYARTITANGTIDLAYQGVDRSQPGAPAGVAGPNDWAFAGAVLDFLEQAEPDLEQKVANEFFWIRVGTLAGNAAAAAEKGGDTPAARSLVLAGPKRWQNEAYWRQHPSHDALASILMFKSDEGEAALARLRERPDLAEEVQQAKDMIEGEMKKTRGRR